MWEFVQREAVKIALQDRRDKISAGVSSQPAAAAAAPSSHSRRGGSSRKRRQNGGFVEAVQSAGRAVGQVGGDTDNSTTSRILNSVRVEMGASKTGTGMKMYEPGKEGDEGSRVHLDPLNWRRNRSAEFPSLACLARCVLAGRRRGRNRSACFLALVTR